MIVQDLGVAEEVGGRGEYELDGLDGGDIVHVNLNNMDYNRMVRLRQTLSLSRV